MTNPSHAPKGKNKSDSKHPLVVMLAYALAWGTIVFLLVSLDCDSGFCRNFKSILLWGLLLFMLPAILIMNYRMSWFGLKHPLPKDIGNTGRMNGKLPFPRGFDRNGKPYDSKDSK